MLQRMITSKQFSEYRVFFKQFEPLESDRADIRAASIEQTVSNLARMWQKRPGRAYKISDFLLDFKPKTKVSWQELKMKFTFWKTARESKGDKEQ